MDNPVNNTEDTDFLVGQLNKLYKEAECPEQRIKKYEDYYSGNFEDSKIHSKLSNANNIIKQIVDTKTTLILDAQISTAIVSKNTSFADIQAIKDQGNLSNVLDAGLKSVFMDNDIKMRKQAIVRDGEKFGYVPVELVWNPDMSKSLGQVEINIIHPRNFRYEKTAKKIEDANFAFIDIESSVYTLKKKYGTLPNGSINTAMLEKIDKLVTSQRQDSDNSGKKPNGIVYPVGDGDPMPAYAYGRQSGVGVANKRLKLKKCYLKDDSVFISDTNDPQNDKEKKQILRFKYPNGRIIVYSGDDENNYVIFEDKPLECPFGTPIVIYNPQNTEDIKGHSLVSDLIYIQDRINRAYEKLQLLVAKFVSTICVDSSQIDLNDDDLINGFVTKLDNMSRSGVPQVVTNNTISEIRNMIEYITMLKNDAKEIGRVNDMMISGSMPTTGGGEVKSAKMVEAMQESPQSSIRETQRSFASFIVNLSNKILVMIQQFYTLPRVIRLSEGKYAMIPNAQADEQGNRVQGKINVLDEKLNAIVDTFNDFSVGDFEVEVIAGTDVPRSSSETAILYEKLMEKGMLGDIGDLDVREIVMKAMDVPNYMAFITLQRKKQEESIGAAPIPLAEKISVGFKDLPIEAQIYWLGTNGFPPDVISEIKTNNGLPPPQAPLSIQPNGSPSVNIGGQI